MRVAPKVRWGFAVAAGYLLVIVLLQGVTGIQYTEAAANGASLFWGLGFSLIIASVLLTGTVTALGWWGPVLSEHQRSRHRWPIIASIFMAILAIVILAATDWSAYQLTFFLASLTLLLVGFTEEVTFRGVLLVALRTRFREVWVWLITTTVFAAAHLVNLVLGQQIAETVEQVFFAFLAGTVFYLTRRVTGSLIPAMILHAFWDFANFANKVGTPADSAFIALGAIPLLGILGLACVPFVVTRANERITFAQRSSTTGAK